VERDAGRHHVPLQHRLQRRRRADESDLLGQRGPEIYGDSAHKHAATSIGASGYTAAYDASGDMTCRAPSGSQTCSGTPTGQLLTYDNEGRNTAWQNAQSSPSSTEQMAYDGEGNRVALQVNGGTPTYYLGALEEISPSGTLTKYLAAGGAGLPTAVRVGTGGPLSYLAADGLGSVSEALDGSGTVTFQQLFTPYGSSRYSSGSSPTTFAFTGQRADAASGLDYYGARYYDPAAGQFSAADSVLDGLNRFGYVGGNPETFTDPSGHDPIPWYWPFIPVALTAPEIGIALVVGGGLALVAGAHSAGESQAEIDRSLAECRIKHPERCPMAPTVATPFCDACSYAQQLGQPTTTGTGGGTPHSGGGGGTHHGHPPTKAHAENPAPGGGGGAGAGKPPRQTHGNPCEPGGSGGDGLPEFTGSPTTGNFVGPDGTTQVFQSGHSLMDISLQPRQLFPDEMPGMVRKFGAWDHVEAQAAIHMRLTGLQEGDLWINNPSGPCAPGKFSCDTNLHHMLPEGAKLRVHWPGGAGGSDMCREYTGTPDSEWNGYEP